MNQTRSHIHPFNDFSKEDTTIPTIDLSTIKIEDLSAECIDTKPINYSWSDHEYGEDWDIVRPDVDDWDEAKCLAFLSDNDSVRHDDAVWEYFGNLSDLAEEAEGSEIDPSIFANKKDFARLREVLDENGIDHSAEDDEFLESLREQCRNVTDDDPDYGVPMMDYAYKLGRSPNLEHVADLPCCTVVQVDGDYYLALTAGGMDLSWEVCFSHVLLGYLPPVHFCDLPSMAGKPNGQADRITIQACLRSVEVMERWLAHKKEDIQRLAAQLP